MEKINPIYKFNNGNGAMICNECRTIISTGLQTKELYCKECKSIKDFYNQMDKEVHQTQNNLNK